MGDADDSTRRPLWAPWRMEYLERADSERRCIFCEPSDAVPDRARLVLHRGPRVFVLLNRFPYAPGHLMVAPYEHAGKLNALASDTLNELMARLADCTRILEATYRCQGLNVGANLGAAAGAGFADHLHFHLVPRWNGDVNFMTSIGELRVISAHLERSYDELLREFQGLPV